MKAMRGALLELRDRSGECVCAADLLTDVSDILFIILNEWWQNKRQTEENELPHAVLCIVWTKAVVCCD